MYILWLMGARGKLRRTYSIFLELASRALFVSAFTRLATRKRSFGRSPVEKMFGVSVESGFSPSFTQPACRYGAVAVIGLSSSQQGDV